MNAQPRRPATSLTGKDVPAQPGVYAWYRDGEPVYSGCAIGRGGLLERIWRTHLGTGTDVSRSALRRNVCEHLGIAGAGAGDATAGPTLPAAAEIEPVNRWIRECEVAWVECRSRAEAEALDKALHAEWVPPLSRR